MACRAIAGLLAGGIALIAVGACGGEEPVPVDLQATTTTQAAGEDPNAAARAQAIGLAEQQCLDDPTKEEGIIQIAVPETGEVVAEVVADCDEVRARD